VGGGGTGAGAPPQGVGSPAWARGCDGAGWWAAVCARAHVHAVRIIMWRRWEPMGRVCITVVRRVFVCASVRISSGRVRTDPLNQGTSPQRRGSIGGVDLGCSRVRDAGGRIVRVFLRMRGALTFAPSSDCVCGRAPTQPKALADTPDPPPPRTGGAPVGRPRRWPRWRGGAAPRGGRRAPGGGPRPAGTARTALWSSTPPPPPPPAKGRGGWRGALPTGPAIRRSVRPGTGAGSRRVGLPFERGDAERKRRVCRTRGFQSPGGWQT